MFPCSRSGPKMPISSLWTVPSSRDSLPKWALPHRRFFFHVADIEAVHEKMEKGGATVSPLVDMGGMRSFSFSDDEGHWMVAAES